MKLICLESALKYNSCDVANGIKILLSRAALTTVRYHELFDTRICKKTRYFMALLLAFIIDIQIIELHDDVILSI